MDFLFFFKDFSSSLRQKRKQLFLPTVYHGFAVFATKTALNLGKMAEERIDLSPQIIYNPL